MKSAAKRSMKKFMAVGNNIALIPGGFQEATIFKKGVDRVFLQKRMGFIKYALQYGYRVHPCYVFGERDTFSTFQPFLKLRLMLNEYDIPGVFFLGDWRCILFPKASSRIVTVVGKGLDFPCIPHPTPQDVVAYHARYVNALQELFDTHKSAAGFPNACLEIW